MKLRIQLSGWTMSNLLEAISETKVQPRKRDIVENMVLSVLYIRGQQYKHNVKKYNLLFIFVSSYTIIWVDTM